MNKTALILAGLLAFSTASVLADDPPIATGAAASKVMLRGDTEGMRVQEMRMMRRNDVLIVQADMENTKTKDRVIYYRFRWLDKDGNQVGDGETFKQLSFMGKQMQTIKGIAAHPSASDFRLELNVEAK